MLSALIPTFNDAYTLPFCLASVLPAETTARQTARQTLRRTLRGQIRTSSLNGGGVGWAGLRAVTRYCQ